MSTIRPFRVDGHAAISGAGNVGAVWSLADGREGVPAEGAPVRPARSGVRAGPRRGGAPAGQAIE